MNAATERRLDMNARHRSQIEDILNGFFPGDEILESIRMQNEPDEQVRVLRIMRVFLEHEARAEQAHEITLH